MPGRDEPSGDAPVLDAARLLELDELQPNFVAELIEVYLAEVASLMSAVRKAVAEGNSEHLRRAAHTLKGASGDLYLANVVRISGVLEDDARRGALEGAAEWLQRLEAAMKAGCEALEALRDRDAGA